MHSKEIEAFIVCKLLLLANFATVSERNFEGRYWCRRATAFTRGPWVGSEQRMERASGAWFRENGLVPNRGWRELREQASREWGREGL